MKLKIEYVPVDTLKTYANNAKIHTAEQVDQIKESIKEFGMCDPIAVWNDNEIIEGHGRLIALKELGIDKAPIIRLDHLTDEQRKAYGLIHNKLTMNTDFNLDILADEIEDIEEIDMSRFGFDLGGFELPSDYYDIYKDGEKGALTERFGVPPFSVLDTRKGEWQNRKREWLELPGDLSETRDGEYGQFGGGITQAFNGGTSNFDPVLAEIAYKWFCVDNGKILDPFAGEQTKGVVAGVLGYGYKGVDIRAEQVAVNREKTTQYKNVKYICGDSKNISKLIKDRDFDMCFTSPPYYDLEVYSKDDLSALGTYEEFMAAYHDIFKQCFDMLKDDSFLVVKVGEIRNKKTGEYRGFIADNINTLTSIGFHYYNALVLVNSAGTAPLRANGAMKTRKVVKVHQNVLVFYKGDLKNIQNKYKDLQFAETDDE